MRFQPSTPVDHLRARRNGDQDLLAAYVYTQAAEQGKTGEGISLDLGKLAGAALIAGLLYVLVNAGSGSASYRGESY